MTSATERLRALLTERGVEWEDCGNGATYVEHNGEAWRFDYDEPFDQLCIVCLSGYAPAQAIDATLGRGTCHITVQDNMTETEGMGDVWLECDACGWQMPLEPSTPRFNYCPNCGRRVEQ